MTHEDLRAEKLEDMRRDMYEEMINERRALEDEELMLKPYMSKIEEAYEILQSISSELWNKYNVDKKACELLREI